MRGDDMTIPMPGGWFNYRVGAIILLEGRILMAKNPSSTYYYTVGGRVQFGESAQEAVLREVFEETQISMEIDKLAFVHENFYMEESSQKYFQEICMFFLMKPSPLLAQMDTEAYGKERGDVPLHWLPISELKNLRAYPEFFAAELENLPDDVQYLVTKDGETRRVR